MPNDGVKKLLNQLAKNPGSALFAAIAEELRKQSRFSQALEVCHQGLERNPRYANGFYTCGRIYLDLKQPSAALEQFSKALDLDPDHLKALEYSAQAAIDLKDWQKAADVLERMLTLSPLHTPARRLQALVHQKQEKTHSTQKKQALVSHLAQDSHLRKRFQLKIIRHIRALLAIS